MTVTNNASPFTVQLTQRQRQKLVTLLKDASVNVPLYRKLYAGLGIGTTNDTIETLLRRLPVLSKADLLATPTEERLNRRYSEQKLIAESTTGSTGQPFTQHMETAYVRRRNLRFLGALTATGYRPWQRLMLLTDRFATSTRRGKRFYEPVEQPTNGIFEAFQRIRPAVLYGFTTPLRLLAETILKSGHPATGLNLVISTAEMLDPATRRTLDAAFRCPVYDFYGMTEMGLVAWQRRGADGYILATRAVLTEFIPSGADDDRYRMYMTNLDLRAAPVVRFDSGDLARIRCTATGPVITAIEGRCIDTVLGRDAVEISPYRITDSLRDVPGVKRFKVTQRELTNFVVDLECAAALQQLATQRVVEVLTGLLGPGLQVEFRFIERLLADGARKFRPVESRVSKQ